jgi:hypothetical protein
MVSNQARIKWIDLELRKGLTREPCDPPTTAIFLDRDVRNNGCDLLSIKDRRRLGPKLPNEREGLLDESAVKATGLGETRNRLLPEGVEVELNESLCCL